MSSSPVPARRAPFARLVLPLLAVLAALAVAGCDSEEEEESGVKEPLPAGPERIRLKSPAFQPDARIPKRFTCDGEDTSPPLRWSRLPRGTLELALLMEDPDAPGGRLVHWSVYGIPPTIARVAEGEVPLGAREGKTSFDGGKYGGPCPPQDDAPHRYVFALYALSARVGLGDGASPDQVRRAVRRRVIARGVLTGRYGR
jgi:Raf kinase inhibitor-like YbhB/YbcL family protein